MSGSCPAQRLEWVEWSLNGNHFDFMVAGANFFADWSAAMTLIGTSVIHID
jgi:hypothetical protein